ncbi:hypothetical protein E4U53_000607 [Claviceps sorghi]|nr:hypothetical protein E4U53_000607 [Claviceps sorghi]
MQLSTSTALAAIAICAGQTLAGCIPGVPGSATDPQSCTLKGNNWNCKDGTTIQRTGSKFTVITQDRPYVAFSAVCVKDRRIKAGIQCTDRSRGDFDLDCAGEVEISEMRLIYN